MLVVVSPAKNLDFDTPANTQQFSQPELLDDSAELIDICRKLSPAQIGSLMKISDKLSGLNADRFAAWQPPFSPDNAKQALLAFNGDVYTGLDAQSMNDEHLNYAQRHLRILSGLYGLLKPLDLMQAYRLEMGTKLENKRGTNLYQFWGDTITHKLNHALHKQGDQVLVNLASNEYFKSVKVKSVDAAIITPIFKDFKNDNYKVISFFAKKARGLMARYIIDNQLSEPEQLKSFNIEGYTFNKDMTSGNDYVFTRKQS